MMVEMTAPTPPDLGQGWFADQIGELLPELYGTAVRLCRDRTDGEDLVAEAVAKAWEALPSLRDRTAFRGWVFQILTNAYLSQYRSAQTKATVEPVGADAEEFSLFERLHQPILLWWGDPEQDFLTRLLREDLVNAIDELPDPFRTVVVLVDVREMSYREVSDLLDVPLGEVRSRLARGRSLLQRALWDNARDAGRCPMRRWSRSPASATRSRPVSSSRVTRFPTSARAPVRTCCWPRRSSGRPDARSGWT